jgi:hypothetical protein
VGGYGSGRRWGAASSARCKVEDCLVLGGNHILSKVIKNGGGNLHNWGELTWSRHGEEFAKIGYTLNGLTMTLDYTMNKEKQVSYPVSLVTTTQPRGGLRYWFKCPAQGCGRVTEKLYKPSGALIFACRRCYNLTYESCNESHLYDSLFRHIAIERGVSMREAKKILIEEGA